MAQVEQEPAQNHLRAARELLAVARNEYAKAQQARGAAAVIGLRNACDKGWLVVLEAAKAFFIKQGVREEELPDNDRGRRYFVTRHMNREMRRAYQSLRDTFYIDGYYEGILEFEQMPEYFDELRAFIDRVEQEPAREPVEG